MSLYQDPNCGIASSILVGSQSSRGFSLCQAPLLQDTFECNTVFGSSKLQTQRIPQCAFFVSDLKARNTESRRQLRNSMRTIGSSNINAQQEHQDAPKQISRFP